MQGLLYFGLNPLLWVVQLYNYFHDRVALHKPWPYEKIVAKLSEVETKKDKLQPMLRSLIGLVYPGKYGEGNNAAWEFQVNFILIISLTTMIFCSKDKSLAPKFNSCNILDAKELAAVEDQQEGGLIHQDQHGRTQRPC